MKKAGRLLAPQLKRDTLCLMLPFGISPKSLFFVTLSGNDARGSHEQEPKRPVSIFH